MAMIPRIGAQGSSSQNQLADSLEHTPTSWLGEEEKNPPGIRTIDLQLTRLSPYSLENGYDAVKWQNLGLTILPGGW